MSEEAFSVDLRLLIELGERLISKDEVALVELVKNSYDADATAVTVAIEPDKLTISDDGVGMDLEQLREGWLALGTSSKKKSPWTAKKRRVLGEKGLGRLAVIRLGKQARLETLPEGGHCRSLTMDWQKAASAIESGEPVPISAFKVSLEDPSEWPSSGSHGTVITISKLDHVWTDDQVEDIRITLARLIEPSIDQPPDFSISLEWQGVSQIVRAPEVVQHPHYTLRAHVDEDGRCVGQLAWNAQGRKGSEELTDIELIQDEVPQEATPVRCGPFDVAVNGWDLDSPELRGYKTKLKEWSGVSLRRNGFRVLQPDVDWLGMDLRRVQNPTMRLSSNQVVATVSIRSDENPKLIDKTDREGLVQSPESDLLKHLCGQVFAILERKRFALRRQARLTRKTLLSPLDTTALKVVAKAVPAANRQAIVDYAASIDSFRAHLGGWILGRDRVATMGMLSAKLIHSARGGLALITENYPVVEAELPSLPEPMRSQIERMVDGGRILDKVFARLDPLLRYRARQFENLELKVVVDEMIGFYAPEMKKLGISWENRVEAGTTVWANHTDWYVILSNFFENSLYWVSTQLSGAPDVTPNPG
jgi:hypothetical protein